MRSVPTALNTELLKGANFLCHLVEMYLSSTVYFTDLDIDVFYNDQQYLSRGLSFDGAAYSLSPQIDKISFQIDNVGLEFSAFVLNQEVRGKRCTIRLAAMRGKDEVILNGGFETAGAGGEDVLADWTEHKSENATIIKDGTVAHSGTASARLYIPNAGHYAMLWQSMELTPRKRYSMKLRYKTSPGVNANLHFKDSGSNVALKADGTWGAVGTGINLSPQTNFTETTIIFLVHENYTNYNIYLGTTGDTGYIYWDDVSIVPLDVPPASVLATAILFSGIIDGGKLDHQRARFDVLSPFVFWRRKTPRRIHQATCPWPFKGTRCGYAGGETWCDQSFDRCAALSNTNSFGGFRWLPSLQNKEIWWGRSPQ